MKQLVGDTVNPAMVTLARETRGFSQSRLASEHLSITQGHLSKIEAGFVPVSDGVLGELCGALSYPKGFFFFTDKMVSPSVSEFFHRKRQSAPVGVIRQIHALINRYLIHVRRLVATVELKTDKFPVFDPDEYGADTAKIAKLLRAHWNIPPGPVEDFVAIIENAGGIVVQFDFGTGKVDAVSRWLPDLPPLFFLNSRMPPDRTRLTLAHELAHIVMHTVPVPDADMERQADGFAAEFLMPETEIRTQLSNLTFAKLATLKKYWRVSMAALLYRAKELRRITPRAEKRLWMRLSKAGYRRREPPELDPPREWPTLLGQYVEWHIDNLNWTTDQLAATLGLLPEEFRYSYGVQVNRDEKRGMLRAVPDAMVR